jgi:tetratricopeptide (TPR) repeat protein
MFLFALLAGSVLGLREQADGQARARRSQKRFILATAGVAFVAWLISAGALAAPVCMAESSAGAGDEFVRTSRFTQAVQAYQDAAATIPYNGEYAFRAARLLQSAGSANADRARRLFDTAIRVNPLSAGYHATRAAFESHQPQPDSDRVRADYDRSLALDPENVETRLEYAKALEALHLADAAREQYEKALWYNDQLAPDEIERLPASRIAEIRASIARLQPTTAATRPS